MVFTIIPTSNAQFSIGSEADQKSIEVEISSSGEVNVKHVVKPSNIPVNVDLFDGTISDISIINENGDERDLAVVGDNDAVLIFPSNQNSIVEYNLDDVLILNDNLWSFKISYPQMVSVLIPEGIDRVFVNDLPIQLGDKKSVKKLKAIDDYHKVQGDMPMDLINLRNKIQKDLLNVAKRTFSNYTLVRNAF